jgi:hypothetical protein
MTEDTTFDDLHEWWESPEMATDDNVLLKLEQISICALAAYTARENGLGEDLVVNIVTTHFGVNDIGQIRRMDFGKVIRYLLDMNPKETIN